MKWQRAKSKERNALERDSEAFIAPIELLAGAEATIPGLNCEA